MNIYKKGRIETDALQKEIDVEPRKNAQMGVLDRLDYLISFCKSKIAKESEDFISIAEKLYKNNSKSDHIETFKADILELIEGKPNLAENIDLAQWCLNYFLDQLNLPLGFQWTDRTAKVTQGDQIRSFLLPRYLNLCALAETVGREKAVSLYKEYISRYRHDTPLEKRNYSTMEDLERKWVESSKDLDSPWEIDFGLIAEGKLAYKNLNCLWVDALPDITDREFMYLVCCYGDYQGAKSVFDESVLLTMEHTIAEGHLYCSRVLHDTSINWDVRHPDKEFWDKYQSNQ